MIMTEKNFGNYIPTMIMAEKNFGKSDHASVVGACRQRSIGLGILPKKVRDDLNSRPLAHRCYSAFIITAS